MTWGYNCQDRGGAMFYTWKLNPQRSNMLIEPKKNDELNQQKWDLSSEPDASFHDLPNSGQFQLQLYTTLLVLQTKKWIWKHHVIGIWRSLCSMPMRPKVEHQTVAGGISVFPTG